MTELTPDHPSVEEVRRHWGLAVDIHRRDERLAEFDRLIQAIKDEVRAEYAMPNTEPPGSKFRTVNGVTSFQRSRPVPSPYQKEGNA